MGMQGLGARPLKTCRDENCNNQFMPWRSTDKYCSPGCAAKHQKPAKPRKAIPKVGRRGKEYIKFARENRPQRNHEGYFICQRCGRWVESVDRQHKEKRSLRPDLRTTKTNIDEICRACHELEDNGVVMAI